MTFISRSMTFAALSIAIVFGGVWLYARMNPPPPVHVVDRLCEFIHGQKLDCVAVLADETGLRPGSIVPYDTQDGPASSIPLPNADLFNDSCLLSGARFKDQRAPSPSPPPALSIPSLTYDVDQSLKEGATVSIPSLGSMSLKAGPSWSDVSRIELNTEKAWMNTLDEVIAVDAYKSCQIRPTCADYIRSSHYRVVGTTVVAKGLSYKIFDKQGNALSLSAGSTSGRFSMDAGADLLTNTATRGTVQSAEPRVIGVRLFPVSAFVGQQVCQDPAVFSPQATVTATIAGGGGEGKIQPRRAEQAINETVRLQDSGSEASECDESFERKQSGASVEAKVLAPSRQDFQFVYTMSARGGHYVTAAACVARQVVGKTGHDTTATASAELHASTSIILREESTRLLTLDFSDMPPETVLRIVDWRGDPLQVPRRVTINGDPTTVYDPVPAQVSRSGRLQVATHGPGLYLVEAILHIAASVTGNSAADQTATAGLRISLAQ